MAIREATTHTQIKTVRLDFSAASSSGANQSGALGLAPVICYCVNHQTWGKA
jgi:hypothetical protein